MALVPVIIGSSCYEEGKDIDVLTPYAAKSSLELIKEQRYDFHHLVPGSSDEDIVTFLSKCENVNYKTLPVGKAIVAPLIINYILKKSHIHRILKTTSSHSENVKLWEKSLGQYIYLRSRFDYTFLDMLIYQDRNSFFSQLYFKRFAETNKRVGDCHNVFTDPDKFFDDNVKRYIPHDELHKKVAMMFRKTEDVLYSRFLKEDSVEMVEQLFKAAEPETQIRILIEEIAVLLLERQLLPLLDKTRVTLNPQNLLDLLSESRSHFICNLCGNDHHWLRRYCLDHWLLLKNASLYQLPELQDLAISILKIEVKDIKVKYPFTKIYLKYITDLQKAHLDELFDDDITANIQGKADLKFLEKKLVIGVEKGFKNYMKADIFDCRTKQLFTINKVIIKTTIPFPEKIFDDTLIIIDSLEAPNKYLLIYRTSFGLFYDGTVENLVIYDHVTISEGNGDMTGYLAKFEKLDHDEILEDKYKNDMWNHPFKETMEKFNCHLFNSSLDCGYYSEERDLILNRYYNNKEILDLFEVFYLTIIDHDRLIQDLVKEC